MDNKKLARLLLGNQLYDDLRAQKVFNPLTHPFPMQQLSRVRIDWDTYKVQPENTYTPFIYIISPTQRSGTNFLSHILNYHPDIQFPEGEDLPMEHCLYSSADQLADYIENTLTFWGKWVKSEEAIDGHAKKMMADMGEGLIGHLRSYIAASQSLLLKTPDAGGVGHIFHLFPEVRIVFLIRDGRDTLESFGRSWGGKGTFKKMSERWANRVKQIMSVKQKAEKAGLQDRILWVRYDELNLNQHEEVRRILGFLDKNPDLYPWDKLDEAPVLGSSAFKKDGNVHWEPVKKTKDFKPVDKWRDWPEARQQMFKKIAGTQLVDLGFENDLNW